MKFRVMSDLHLEFGALDVPVMDEDFNTILILAGDIHVGKEGIDFIDKMIAQFKEVVMVLGNHEFYHHDMEAIRKFWQSSMKYRSNLHVLDPGTYEFNGVRIIGATLWTATNDPAVELFLNDYYCIYHDGDTLTAQGTRDLHLADLEYITDELQKPFDGTTIVVTHHAPLGACVHPKYEGNELNKSFHSNLDYIIAEYDIDMWIHGHMHDSVHFVQDDTEVFANPRGYAGYESNTGFRDDFVVEF